MSTIYADRQFYIPFGMSNVGRLIWVMKELCSVLIEKISIYCFRSTVRGLFRKNCAKLIRLTLHSC